MRRIAIALVVALGAPASAQARVHTIAPPGNSGVGQYVETVPTAGGGQPTSTVHPGAGPSGGSGHSGGPGGAGTAGTGGTGGTGATGGSAGSSISSATQRALTAQGPAGAAAAALARATAPSRSPSETGTNAASTGDGSAPASSVLKTLTGSTSGDGLGPLLPLLLIASLLGAAVLALVRRRRTS